MKYKILAVLIVLIFGGLSLTRQIFAHEVYVLDQSEIDFAMKGSPINFMQSIQDNTLQFFTAGFIGVLLVTFIFIISISKRLETNIDPFLYSIKNYAPIVTQVTLASALIASSYYQAFFGVELPMQAYGYWTMPLRLLVFVSGVLIGLGIFSRIGASIVILTYGMLCVRYGIYMTNYVLYFGEGIAIFLFGASYSLFPKLKIEMPEKILKLKRYKFPIMRIFFGVSLIYAALYAKFFHGELALLTVEKYHLAQYIPFDPVFIVLGALIIEVIIGVFYLLGLEIRFTSLFFSGFLIISVLFFKESVWPHIVLLGTALSMAIHGYDRFTLEGFFFGKNLREPIL